MLKILVADNSALMRRSLCDIINSDKDFHVIDMSLNGEDAYNKISKGNYDLVIMEMVLPRMDGLEVLERLLKDGNRTKVIAISTAIKEETEVTVKALELGACDFVKRPAKINGISDDFSEHLLKVMHNAVEGLVVHQPRQVEPVKRMPEAAKTVQPASFIPKPEPQVKPKETQHASASREVLPQAKRKAFGKPSLIALACSTGGPQALHKMVPMLPANLSVPLVLVQHMPAGFTQALANRLNQTSEVTVKEAEDDEVLKAGHVYIAPGGRHLQLVENQKGQVCAKVVNMPPVNSLKPCADVMYESIQKLSIDNILCVVLTGMGADGTKGIEELQKHKNTYVITESRDTCVVYGMPKSVDNKGLSNESVPIEKVSEAIIKKLGD